MSDILIRALLCAFILCVAYFVVGNEEQHVDGGISMRLYVQSHTDDSVRMSAEITNHYPLTISLLNWYTPLEGVKGNIFKVTDADGEDLPYRGIMMKRGLPPLSAFTEFAPGQTITANFELSIDHYDFNKAGEPHSVQFDHFVQLWKGDVHSIDVHTLSHLELASNIVSTNE